MVCVKQRKHSHEFFEAHNASTDEMNTSESHKEGKNSLLVITTRTVSRWIARFQKAGGDIRALFPSFESSGPHGLYMLPQVHELLEQAIANVYTPYQKVPVTRVFEEVRRLIIQANTNNPLQEPLILPSKRTVYRYINNFTQSSSF